MKRLTSSQKDRELKKLMECCEDQIKVMDWLVTCLTIALKGLRSKKR